MLNAKQVLHENPIPLKDLMSENGEALVEHLIWLGQVEVINRVAINEAHKLALLQEIKYEKK